LNRKHIVIDGLIDMATNVMAMTNVLGRVDLGVDMVAVLFEAGTLIDEEYHMKKIDEITADMTDEDRLRVIGDLKRHVPYDDRPDIHEFLNDAKEYFND
jgi:hypothetical protein